MLDHWERLGDWSQQWLNLRYVTRLLVRLGADEDAITLHRALVRAGKPSPLDEVQIEEPDAVSGVEAVARARSALGRYV